MKPPKHSEVQALFVLYAAAKVAYEDGADELNQWIRDNKPPTGEPITSDLQQIIQRGRWRLYSREKNRRWAELHDLEKQKNLMAAKLKELLWNPDVHQPTGRFICEYGEHKFNVSWMNGLQLSEVKK